MLSFASVHSRQPTVFLRLKDVVFFFLPKQSQNSRSVSLGLFRKGKTHIIAKFQMPDLDICTHSGVGKTRPIAK